MTNYYIVTAIISFLSLVFFIFTNEEKKVAELQDEMQLCNSKCSFVN